MTQPNEQFLWEAYHNTPDEHDETPTILLKTTKDSNTLYLKIKIYGQAMFTGIVTTDDQDDTHETLEHTDIETCLESLVALAEVSSAAQATGDKTIISEYLATMQEDLDLDDSY